jgi:hypothetical protein
MDYRKMSTAIISARFVMKGLAVRRIRLGSVTKIPINKCASKPKGSPAVSTASEFNL